MDEINNDNNCDEINPTEIEERDITRIKYIIEKKKVWTFIKKSNSFVEKNCRHFRAKGYENSKTTNFAFYNDPDKNEKGKLWYDTVFQLIDLFVNVDFIVHVNMESIKDIIFCVREKHNEDEAINYSEKLLATLIYTGTLKVIYEFI